MRRGAACRQALGTMQAGARHFKCRAQHCRRPARQGWWALLTWRTKAFSTL
jgi:hypothetical protein